MTKIRVNKVYTHLKRSSKKIVVEQGGTRSGKTYNILLWIIFHYCGKHTGHTITIARKTFPAVRSSVMRDFFDILKQYDIYSEESHNKSNSEYILNGNLVEFVSLDQPQKIRGRKRDLAFLNEANELTFEDWQQIVFRTSGRIVIDYNPSDTFHWIYDRVIPRDDADFYQTTYRDNPFLDTTIVAEIERLTKHKISRTAKSLLGYKEVGGFLKGEYSYARAKELLKRNTRRYAKRQLTWFRREKGVKWIEVRQKDTPDLVAEKIYSFLV